MKDIRRNLVMLFLAALVALPLCAYDLVLNDGRVINFQKYRVEGDKLFYIGNDGKEVSISLTDVDLGRTRQLNVAATPPLELPGLKNPSEPTSANTPTSLAEIARKVRKSNPTTSKRVFTSEDFSQGDLSSDARTPNNGKTQDPSELKEMARQVLHELERETDQQAIQEILGADASIQFPERPSWEREVLFVRQKYLSTLRQCLSDRVSEREEMLRACDRFSSVKYDFESLGQKGRKLAANWKSAR